MKSIRIIVFIGVVFCMVMGIGDAVYHHRETVFDAPWIYVEFFLVAVSIVIAPETKGKDKP